MADYYPLISRAVEALSDKSPDMRGAVYDRARTALLEQLRSLEPPLSETDITRERVALDDAIQRIEIDYGGQADVEPPEVAAPVVATPLEPPRAQPPQASYDDEAEQERFEREHHAANEDHSADGGHWPEAEAHTEPRPAARPTGFSLPEPKRRPEIDDFIAAPAAEEAGPESVQRERPRVDTVAPRRSSGGGRRAAILGSALVLVIGAIGFTAYSLRDAPSSVPAPVATPAAPQADADGKIAERVGGERPPAAPANPMPAQPAPAPARNDVAVAQRAVIYEENAANPQQPNATAGRALWRVDALNAGQGQPLETAVRASVEIPDAGLTLNLLMRRNLDPTLPASHTIELSFTTQGEEARRVRDVGLLQLKNEEAVRGAPIAGLPVPVKDNLFLIGLSNLQSDMDRNKDLLTRRNWIDLPIRLAGGQRAIVSFEKGVSGDQVLNQAFRQWDEAAPAGATR